jgi:predicted nucleic acid-binding protein
LLLVDTNVISATAVARTKPKARFLIWMDRNSDLLFLSVVTVARSRAAS